MASAVVDDKSAALADESDAAAATTVTTSSCLNDPNYAIICVFLEKFGAHLKIEHPDFLQLQKMIENTDEVHEDLKQFMIRLLRKTRKSVQPDKLDSALAKFCYTYSSQDAWEIERFGFKKSSLAVKLRILKEILESQFDKNPAFRTVISAQSAIDLRSQPLGKDKLGNAYWSTLDEQCNLRIYQEHLDEEIWKVVATNRDEMVKLISCLKGNELVLPSLVGIVDEDSSSNSMPPKVDALQNGALAAAAVNQCEALPKCENVPSLKIKLNAGNSGESTVEQIKTDGASAHAAKGDAEDDGDDDDDEDESNVSEIDESSQAASESSATTIGTKSNETQSSKRYSLLASKPPSNKSKHRIPASDSKARINAKIKTQSWSTGGSKRSLDGDEDDREVVKIKRPSMMMSGNKRNVASNKYNDLDDGETSDEDCSEDMEDELEEEEEEELSEISDGDVGDEIEEPTLYVRGEGSGKANKSAIPFGEQGQFDDAEDNAVGDAITEEVMYVFGEGLGHDCDVGNNDIKATTEASSSNIAAAEKPLTQAAIKPMFFFGQAGCLKLSPMKTTIAAQPKVQSPNSLSTTENVTESNTKDETQEISSSNNDIIPKLAMETTSNYNILTEAEQNKEKTANNVPSHQETEENPNNLQDDNETIKTVPIIGNNTKTESNENQFDGEYVETGVVESDVAEPEQIAVEEELCQAKVAYVTTAEKGAQSIEYKQKNESIAGDARENDVNAGVIADNEPTPYENFDESEPNEHTSAVVNEVEDEKAFIDQLNEESYPLASNIVGESNSEQNQSLNNQEIESSTSTDGAIEMETKNFDEERPSDTRAPAFLSQDETAVIEIPEEVNSSLNTAEVGSESIALESAHSDKSVETKVLGPIKSVDDNGVEQSTNIENIEIANDQSECEKIVLDSSHENIMTKCEGQNPTEVEISMLHANVEFAENAAEQNDAVDTVEVNTNRMPDAANSSNFIDKPDQVEVEKEPDISETEIAPSVEESFGKADDTSGEETMEQIRNESDKDSAQEESQLVLEEPSHIEQTSQGVSSQPEELTELTAAAGAVLTEHADTVALSGSIARTTHEHVVLEEPPHNVQSNQGNLSQPSLLTESTTSVEAIPIEPSDVIATNEPIATVPHVDYSQHIPVVNEHAATSAIEEEIASEITDVAAIVDTEPIYVPSTPTDHCKRDKPIISEIAPKLSLTSEKRKGDELSSSDGNECKKICEEGRIVDESSSSVEDKEPLPVERAQVEITPLMVTNDRAANTINPNVDVEASAMDDKLNLASSIDNREELTKQNAIWNENDTADNSRRADAKLLVLLPKSPTAEISNELKQNTSTEVKNQDVEDEVTVKLPSPKTEPIPIKSKVSPTKAVQSRTRKRRLSGQKIQLSSESENDGFDAALPVQQDASSEAEVGGKRIKMRTKLSLRNVRKSAEEKRRSQKESECSSDDNDKLIAKQSTSESRPKLRSRKIEVTVVEPKSKPKLENVDQLADEKPPIEIISDIKSEEVKRETEQIENAEVDNAPGVAVAAPRRAGRPPRKAAAKKPAVVKSKAVPKASVSPKKEKNVKSELDAESEVIAEPEVVAGAEVDATAEVVAAEAKEESSSESAKPQPRKKKRSLLGLDVSEVAIIPVTSEGETPVRQSRRIAQIKIKEEAERRKAEEIALKKMKEASEKQKKGSSRSTAADAPSDGKSASEEDNSESEQKLEKKKKRKKGNKERPWQTDSSDSSERDEDDVDDHEEVERLPPLRSDHEFSPESDIEDVIVPTKRARTARKDVTEKDAAAETSETEDIHACQKCGKSDHPEWILLCDKCDKGYHCSCLIPVLFVIPEGSWFCPPCQQEKLIEELDSKLIAYDAIFKQKEIEEANRQRILFTSINEANVLKEAARKGKPSRERSQRRKDDASSDEYSSSSTSSESGSEKIEKRPRRPRQLDKEDEYESNSDRTSAKRNDDSSSATDSENEPIYKLRKRRQTNVSYRFNEFDELINRAIKSEMDEVAGAGNLGRGKDISTIIEADMEEKRHKKEEENEVKSRRESESDHAENAKPALISRGKHMGDSDEDSDDSEPIKPKVVKRSSGKSVNKKKKKLNSLDVDSDEDDFDSDDDFKTSSYSDDEEEEDATSADSESSLEFLKKRGEKGRTTSQRPVRQRKKRYDADFIDDNSDDDDDIPLIKKKKKKIESDFSDFNDSSDEEVEEDVDSEDLCDDSSEGSDRPWQKSRKSAKSKPKSVNTSRPVAPKSAPKKRPLKNDDERAFKGSTKKKAVIASGDEDEDEVLPKSRRTRGKRLPYLLEDEFDSSDDGIKPGVKRPDTPPEERAAFIQKQEEIKRMLAEKNADVTKPISGTEKPKKNTPKDSLSTIPAQIIQTAKALDVDLKKTAIVSKTTAATSDNDSNGFDGDLPEDFDPEDMDEDEIAKMMEEEDFAQQQLKLAGEAIRNKRLKDTNDESPKKDVSAMKIETSSSGIMPHLAALVSPTNFSGSLTIPDIPPSMYTVAQTGSGAVMASNSKITTTPKKRGRKFKDDNILFPPGDMAPKAAKSLDSSKDSMIPVTAIQHTASLAHQKPPPMQMHRGPSTMHSPPIQQHTTSVISHSSSVIQHQRSMAPSSSSLLGIARNQEPIIPTAVLEVQNTRLLDPSELGRPPQLPPSSSVLHDPAVGLLEGPAKKRGRRKKITPLRDALTSPTSAGVDLRHPNMPSQPPLAVPTNSAAPTNSDMPKTSILSERLAGNPVDNKRGLAIGAQPPPPHLYAPPSASQTSVIRLNRPPHNAPFNSGNAPQQQRYYPPNHALPPPSHTIPSHVRSPYHAPNAIVTSSGHRQPPLVNTSPSSSHLSHPMYMRRGQPTIYGTGYPGMPPPQMHRAMEAAGGSAQEYSGPYQNLPFGNYYPSPGPTTAHLSSSSSSASSERRSSVAAISTFEQFDNVNKISAAAHDRYVQHHSNHSITTISAPDDERSARSCDANATANTAASAGGGSEFSGLVSYFSSQQDDLDT